MDLTNFSLIILSYFIGSIPWGLIISKTRNIDIRQYGSGNIGATNVTRIIGRKLGLLTLVLDSIKSLTILYVADIMNLPYNVKLHIGLASVIGHIFPIWLKFKGGKGVATALSAIVYLNPILGIIMICCWLLIFKIFRISSLASISIFTLAPVYSYIFANREFSLFCLIVSIIVVLRHYKNIVNLINNKENVIK